MILGEQVGTDHGWASRSALISPLMGATTTCELLAGALADGGSAPSLGLIKPRDIRFAVEVNPHYRPLDRAPLQVDLFGHEKDLLEESPVVAKFAYKCASRQCRGHQQTLIDWESGQLARRNRSKGPDEMVRLHRQRFLDQMCGDARDTYFYVGNMHQHPRDFLVLGLWSPPAVTASQGLFDLTP